MKKGIVPGIILIAAGLYFLLEQVAVFPDGASLALVGVVLLVLRALRGGYGFTIAGCMALALGTINVLEDIDSPPLGQTWCFGVTPWQDAVPLFLLAAAFVAIYLIERRRGIIWPLIPALCLTCAGVMSVGGGDLRLRTYWPVLLICAGAVTLVGAFRRGKAKYTGPDTPPIEPQAQQEERKEETKE